MPSSPTPRRLHNLDYLRGIAATGIMTYHLTSWWFTALPAQSFLGRVGVYGVAIFYVLSGLTLFHVYADRMHAPRQAGAFVVRRVFRIFPLLWITTLAALLIVPQNPRWQDLLLSFSGLFGFVKWDVYFSAGVWSIGNELFFYALFPILIALARTRTAAFVAAGAILGGGFLYFAFVILSPGVLLADQWVNYINPANQAFLFYLGIAIGYMSRRVRPTRLTSWLMLAAGIVLFVAWPVGVNSVTGISRIALTAACVMICAAAYHLDFALPKAAHVPLAFLGEASYSIYLLHPVVNEAIKLTPLAEWPRTFLLPTIVLSTLAVSWLSYRGVERPLMRAGRALTSAKVVGRGIPMPRPTRGGRSARGGTPNAKTRT